MLNSKSTHLAATAALTFGVPVQADAPEASLARQNARLAWWQEGKIGLFLHWGAYSQEGGSYQGQGRDHHEWLMLQAKIPVATWEAYCARMNPAKFDADAWVRAAKDAGIAYIVITAKHHDGFAMFRSPSNRFNIADLTSFKRDPLKELADACARHGVKFCPYYSLGRDWHDPDAFTPWPVKGARSNTWDFPDEDAKVFGRYFRRKVVPQVRELLTGYGPLGMIWFDTPGAVSREESQELQAMIRTLQPDCLINDRIGNGLGDFETVEKKLVPNIKAGPWETCMTMARMWSYNRFDTWKSSDTIIHALVDTVSKGGNFLINIGPDGAGALPPEGLERLAAMGRWTRINGEAIYGTQPWEICGEGPSLIAETPEVASKATKSTDVVAAHLATFTAQDIRFTSKNGALYALALGWPDDGKLTIKSLAAGSPHARGAVQAVELLGAKTPLVFERDADGLHIRFPSQKPCESAFALKITLLP